MAFEIVPLPNNFKRHKDMLNIPLLTWSCIVGLVIMAAIAGIIGSVRRKNRKHRHIIGFSSERELLYIPGDPLPHNLECKNHGRTE